MKYYYLPKYAITRQSYCRPPNILRYTITSDIDHLTQILEQLQSDENLQKFSYNGIPIFKIVRVEKVENKWHALSI